MSALRDHETFVIVDLECTCWENDPRMVMETIEIGAVVYGVGQGILAEFQRFVRPKLNPVLSDFCRNLTTIEQSQVDAAPGFPEAFSEFVAWFNAYPSAVLCSWGGFDHKQLRRDCELHGMEYPFVEHVNIKIEFARTMGCKPCGMSVALQRAGLPLDGTHHRGIDDARNIARLLGLLLERDTEGPVYDQESG